MSNFLKSDIKMVRARVIKSSIIAGILMAIIIGMIISQGNFARFMRRGEWVQAIGMFFVIGGIRYGKHIIAAAGKAPIDGNTGEPYYPGGFNGSIFRWLIAIALGATVGTVMFVIDVVRLVSAGVKNIMDKNQSNKG